MRRGAILLRVGVFRRRRIVQGPDEPHRIAVARGEKSFGQIERGLEQRQQPQAEGRHGVAVAGEGVSEPVQPVRPGVDPVQRPPFHDRRVVRRQFRTDQEGFAEVRFRRIRPVLIRHRHIAAMAHVDPDCQLVGHRLAEKALRCGEGILDDAFRNAVVRDAEEADPLERGADVRRRGGPARLDAGQVAVQVDNGNPGCRNAAHPAVSSLIRFKLVRFKL